VVGATHRPSTCIAERSVVCVAAFVSDIIYVSVVPFTRSLTSILSDLPDASSNAFVTHGTDFMEGMKSIYDALHDDDYRDVGSSNGALFPTFSLPYRGGNGVRLTSRRNSSLASHGLDAKQ
jgi:hypothetical protein